jgi:uroporphyrinogen decarboxylase
MGKIGSAFFDRAWSLRGFENFLMDLMVEEAFVKELFEQILSVNLQIIDEAVKYDIDGFYFGDDYGQQNGLLMSPVTWRIFIKPYLAIMFERVKKSGKIVALHSCGNISEIMGDLIEICNYKSYPFTTSSSSILYFCLYIFISSVSSDK